MLRPWGSLVYAPAWQLCGAVVKRLAPGYAGARCAS
jgi:hypothetical protein